MGRQDGDAKPQGTAIGHHDMAGALGGMAHRQDLEASAEEGMGGVGHLDHFGIERRWVLEGGIKLLSRLTTSTIRSCCRYSERRSTTVASSPWLKMFAPSRISRKMEISTHPEWYAARGNHQSITREYLYE